MEPWKPYLQDDWYETKAEDEPNRRKFLELLAVASALHCETTNPPNVVAPSATTSNYVAPITPTPNYVAPRATSPNYVATNPTTSGYVAPRTPSPNYVAPRATSPNYVAPNPTTSDYVAPRTPPPNYVAPRATSPNYVAPNPTTSSYVAPRTPTPNSVAPRATSPNYVTPKTTLPNYFAPSATTYVGPNAITHNDAVSAHEPHIFGHGTVRPSPRYICNDTLETPRYEPYQPEIQTSQTEPGPSNSKVEIKRSLHDAYNEVIQAAFKCPKLHRAPTNTGQGPIRLPSTSKQRDSSNRSNVAPRHYPTTQRLPATVFRLRGRPSPVRAHSRSGIRQSNTSANVARPWNVSHDDWRAASALHPLQPPQYMPRHMYPPAIASPRDPNYWSQGSNQPPIQPKPWM